MIKITIGKENKELVSVGPSELTDKVNIDEFGRLLIECNKNPGVYWIRIQSEFLWNERVSQILYKLCKVNTFLVGNDPCHDELLGLICSIGDSEGYLQQVKGEF